MGAAPSATQAQKVRRIEQRRARWAKPHKTATARVPVPSPLAALRAAVRFSKTGPKILVGAECSGLESVMAAFDKMDLGDRAQLQFICEKDTAARNLILAHRRPKVVFNDITTRPVQKMPVCDIYAVGIPCQPWSSAGLGEGTSDRQGRGQIFSYVYQYILNKAPKAFILEKRQGFDHGHTPEHFQGVFEVPTGWVGQQVHCLLARAQHS